ncbi:acyl-CoA dehydrogenase family protein [Celeribacter persicus]|jgi:Acyl-CoA dehydrogenases|uniref:Alkylation response protein AidB-like acyl-CoA dehydrogenase n=1 Tax=Celeribacter persicus TaxID=1651082 RepID=A0A2T5HUW7_9RHOB|nr:acyl-CoA dehydrogenase family protein [Celeribacter persicus]PTQ75354.1 alkylation response protein AidB-like acyl-CoA dehydrogenase [Celeribacter persicus]
MTYQTKLAFEQANEAAYVGVLDEIRARRAEFTKLRHVPLDMVQKLQQIGAYRAFVPARFGGDELSPADFCRLIEDIAAADASTGWVASFGVSATYLAALPPETYAQIYAKDPDTVFAGAMFPPQKAEKVEGGFKVSGRWPWCSGIMGSSVVGVGIKVEGDDTPLPRVAVMPRDKVTVDEVWDTIGLSATGSHDAVAEDVVVAPEWTFIRGGKPLMDDAIFRFPAMALAAQVLAVVALGAAREALDFLVEDARQRASITGAPNPGARPYVQAEFAKAQGLLMGARAAFYDTIEAAWDELKTTGDVSPDMKIRLRLVATKAARDGAEAARIAFVIGGSGVMMTGHTLGRCMVDAACVAQHAFMGEGTWTAAGAGFFDQPTMPGYP